MYLYSATDLNHMCQLLGPATRGKSNDDTKRLGVSWSAWIHETHLSHIFIVRALAITKNLSINLLAIRQSESVDSIMNQSGQPMQQELGQVILINGNWSAYHRVSSPHIPVT